MKKSSKKMTVEQAFEEFIDWKRPAVAQATLENYIAAYQIFCSETGAADQPLEFLNKKLIEDWKLTRLNSSSPISSSNQYITAVRVFLYWLMDQEYIPFFFIKLLKRNQPGASIRKYDEADIKKLLEKPKSEDKYIRWRDWLIINIIMATGARIGSLVWLKREDIGPDTITFTHTKTHKVLTLPLSPSLKRAINIFYSTWDIDSEYIITTQTGRQTHTNPLRYSLGIYCKERGIECKGFHALRHSMAYLMWKNGADLLAIQYFLGHSNLEMTRHYIDVLTEDFRDTSIPLDFLIKSQDKKVKRK